MAPLPVPKSVQGRLDKGGEEEERELSSSAFLIIPRNAAAARSTSCSVSGRGHSTPLPTARVTRRQCAIPTAYWKGKRSFIRASQRSERSGRDERRETTGDGDEEEEEEEAAFCSRCCSLCSLSHGGDATASSRNQSSSFCRCVERYERKKGRRKKMSAAEGKRSELKKKKQKKNISTHQELPPVGPAVGREPPRAQRLYEFFGPVAPSQEIAGSDLFCCRELTQRERERRRRRRGGSGSKAACCRRRHFPRRPFKARAAPFSMRRSRHRHRAAT